MIRYKLKSVIILIVCMILSFNTIEAEEVIENISNSFNMEEYISSFENYMLEHDIEGIDIHELYNNLISGKGIEYRNIIDKIANNFLFQMKESLNGVINIFVIVIIMAILSNLNLDKGSSVVKITRLVIVISISSILLKNYVEIVKMFKDIVNVLSFSMQIASTFLTGILVATGKITTTGVIQPLVLLVSNGILVICNYVVIPIFTLSISINIISKIGDNMRLDRLSDIFRKSSLYVFSSLIAIFVLIISMESSVTKSIDNIYFKTTQNIVSDAVPVVGGFLSDTLDIVLGATELIGKVGGTVAIVSIIVIASIPILKLIVVVALYKILCAISEPINEDKMITEFIDGFANIYKDLLGILIGVMTLFIMTTGIIMSMIKTIG